MGAYPILVYSENNTLYQQLRGLLPSEYVALHLETTIALQEALQAQEGCLLILALSPMNEGRILNIVHESIGSLPLVFITHKQLQIARVNELMTINLQAVLEYPFQNATAQAVLANTLNRIQQYARAQQAEAESSTVNQQLDERLREIDAIYTVGKSVTSSLDVEEVLERIVAASIDLTQAEEGFILLTEGEKLYLRIAKNMNEEVATRFYTEATDHVARQVVQTGRPAMLHRDMKIVTGYLVRSLLYVPIQAPNRGTIGVLGVVNIFSARTFTENQLFTLSSIADYAAIALENARLFSVVEAERSRLSAILSHAAEVILVTDTDNRLWLWSEAAAAHFDIQPADRGQYVTACVENATIRALFAQAYTENLMLHAEVDLENGRSFNVQLSSIDHIGRVAVMQDITHLKELDRLKSEFVSTVSHDLRTPLTTVQGYIELLERVGPLTDIQRSFVEKAMGSLSHITALITDVLDIGRIEAGYDLEMELCDINILAKETADAHAIQCEQKSLHLQTSLADQPAWVHGNARRLRQVFDNLVSNAIKYNRVDGWIKIEVNVDEKHITVRVADNGIGIPVEEQPKVFERFYRVHSPETEETVGTGLGLAIVKSVIEKHKGRVWVRSYPGQGSIFAFVLAAQPAPQAQGPKTK